MAPVAHEPSNHGPSGPWAHSEIIFPGDGLGRLWEAYSLAGGQAPGSIFWPVTVAEICREVSEKATGDPGKEASSILPLLRATCQDREKPRPLSLTLAAGAYPLERKYPLGHPFEEFTSGWGSVLVDPEVGGAWTRLPPLLDAELRYPVSPRSFVHFRLGLKRDLAAWHQDDMGLNVPTSGKEVDLNEPSLGYFHAETDRFAFTAGRFPAHWSPSAEYGLALSHAVPYHNGAAFAIKTPRVRYRFLVSSLNPWLEGTPVGPGSSEDYPPGSEEYRQRHYDPGRGASIFHKRVYDSRVKTLFAHRVEGDIGPLGLGITETQVIGGKTPDLRDAGPFVVFHNDFKDGYTNVALSLDGTFRMPAGFSLAAEFYMDDVQYSEPEGEGNTASLFGYLAAIRHAFSVRGWGLYQSLHAIRTDPFLYGYLLPLNTMASRHILSSNYQHDGDAVFVDKFVVDYPMGYARGGDAYDFRYRLEAWRGTRLKLALTADILAQGEVELHTPQEEYYDGEPASPSGVAERELRLRLEGSYGLLRGLTLRAGAAWQGIRNRGHVSGERENRFQAGAGVSWEMPR